MAGISQARAADLMDLLARAEQYDPAYAVARLELQVAGESLREARSGLKPQLSGNLEVSNTYLDIRESDNILYQVGSRDFFGQRFTVSLIQPLWQPATRGRLGQARAEIQQAEAQLEAARQDLIYRLAEAHFSFLAARDALDLAEAESQAIQQQLQESEERLGSGLGSLTDVYEARARFAFARSRAVTAANDMERARQALAEITGVAPEDLLRLVEAFPLVTPDRPEESAWVEAARFQNPVLLSLEAAVEIAGQEVERQQAGFKPRLDLAATFDGSDSGGSNLAGGGGSEIYNTEVAVRLGIPIYSGGRISAQAAAARLRQRIAEQQLEQGRRRIESETRVAFQGVMGGIARAEALTQSVFSQESVLSAKEEGLRSGLSTGLDVLDARRDLFSARRDLAQARYLYILSTLKLKQAAGILSELDLREIDGYLQ
jgi:outer membrane protein